MNKKLLTLAILACGAFGFSAMAQDEGIMAISEEAPANPNNKMYQPQQFTDYAFEGIILDTDQQAKMDKINAEFQPIVNGTLVGPRPGQPCPGDNAQCKQTAKGPRPDKANCDSAQCKGPRSDFKARRGGQGGPQLQEARKAYAQQVKQVLTPEQYIVFLENIAFAPQQPQMGPQGGRQLQVPKAAKDQKAKAIGERKAKAAQTQVTTE